MRRWQARMNEISIVIKAMTSEAQKNIQAVSKELKNVQTQGDKSGQSLAQTMTKIGKVTAIATGAIVGLTTAMAMLGKTAQDVNKGIERLNTTFKSAGSTTKQAQDTYKELFGIFGDHDKAVETAQSLARITTEADKLAEYYDILAGSAAKYGEGLNPEAFSEQISETIASSKAMGDLERVLVEAGVSVDAFNNSLAQTADLEQRELLVRSTLNSVLGATGKLYRQQNQATIEYNKSQASLNLALAQASSYTTPLLTSINNLSATFLGVFGPAIRTVSLYLTGFIQILAETIAWIGKFFGIFSGKSNKATADYEGYQQAMNNYNNALRNSFKSSGSGIDSNIKKLKDLKKQTMGFDELNIMSSPTDTSTGTGSGGGGGGGAISLPEMPNPEDFGIGVDLDFTEFQKDLEVAKEHLKGIAVLVAAVASGFAIWKIGDFLTKLIDSYNIAKQLKGIDLEANWNSLTQAEIESVQHLDKVKAAMTKIGGIAMIVAGAILLIKGYTDAWANGIDWGNMALMIGGVALAVAGLALAYGPVAAGIGAIVGGIALLVIGIKDFIENGYSMESVLTILAGVIAVVVGVCLAFNAALLANPITWIVIAIAALVAAFVILWNECEGFRNFWINLWEKVKELFGKFVESIKPLIDAMVGAFKEAWEVIKVVWNDYLVPLFQKAWEIIKSVWDAVKPYFEKLWEGIKAVFSVVADVLGSFFSAAWEVIKNIWNAVVGYFTAIWDTIKGIFSVVKNVLSGNWEEAWESIKGIVNTWKDYFKKVWDSIKGIFSAVGKFFKDIFGGAWDAIKGVFSKVGDFFTGIWNSIKNIFKSIGEAIGSAVSNAFSKAVNWVLEKAIGIINGFIKAINLAIGVINLIPGVNISKLNLLDVPKMAKGGIVDRATFAMIGEQGKEAVVPLENNTEWMDKLAEKIGGNGPSKIVLMLDGKELGWASIRSINGITRQTGQLQLKMM